MNVHSIEVYNKKVAYQDEGKGEVFLLIHGFCGSSTYWNEVIPELSKTNRVLAIDLPGHGDSEVWENMNEIYHYADFIQDFLDELEVEKVTMVGHSLGGYITLAFAESYSNRLNGFSLVHSTAYADSIEAKEGRVSSAYKIDEEGMEVFIDGLVPKLFAPDHIEGHQKAIEEAKKIGYTTSSVGAKNALHAMKERKDRTAVLENTKLPVLLVAGDSDQLIPSEKTFTASGENIKQVLVKDVGHMSMYEAPIELLKAIKQLG